MAGHKEHDRLQRRPARVHRPVEDRSIGSIAGLVQVKTQVPSAALGTPVGRHAVNRAHLIPIALVVALALAVTLIVYLNREGDRPLTLKEYAEETCSEDGERFSFHEATVGEFIDEMEYQRDAALDINPPAELIEMNIRVAELAEWWREWANQYPHDQPASITDAGISLSEARHRGFALQAQLANALLQVSDETAEYLRERDCFPSEQEIRQAAGVYYPEELNDS